MGVFSHTGLLRPNNEDAYCHCQLSSMNLLVVADGMGGHKAGEVASQLAIDRIKEYFEEHLLEAFDVQELLAQALLFANRGIYEQAADNLEFAGMGTTVTAALVKGKKAYLAHIGDSRAYLYRHGELFRLTADHNLVQQMLSNGEITEDEAYRHPQRNLLLNAMGTASKCEIDEDMVELQEGDLLLLCTDGLTSMLTDDELLVILQENLNPEQLAVRLVDAANDRGGQDNTTVIAALVTAEGQEVGM